MKKIIVMLLKMANISLHETINLIAKDKLEKLWKLCKHLKVRVIGTNSFESAQVCAGGVRTTEVNPDTLESLCMDGLYLTGELLDIDGICGGWAWSTGYVAGKNAAKGK